jgi:hypothetical protein
MRYSNTCHFLRQTYQCICLCLGLVNILLRCLSVHISFELAVITQTTVRVLTFRSVVLPLHHIVDLHNQYLDEIQKRDHVLTVGNE